MVYFLCKVNFKTSLYSQTSTEDAELLNSAGNLVFFKGRFSRFDILRIETLISAVMKKLDVICLTHMNRLILILCCWLLKKTLVITTSLTNPECAPEFFSLTFRP